MKKQIIEKLEQLRDLLGIDENEKIAKEIMILAETLDQYYFTEKQFDNACKKMIEDTSETYNKMPNFAKLKNLMENQFFKLKTKDEAKKDFFIEQNKWISRELNWLRIMIEDDKKGNFKLIHFVENGCTNEFKKMYLKNEEATVENVRKKMKTVLNSYNQNEELTVKRMKQLFIEEINSEMAGILNIKPMLEPSQEKVTKILNGNI